MDIKSYNIIIDKNNNFHSLFMYTGAERDDSPLRNYVMSYLMNSFRCILNPLIKTGYYKPDSKLAKPSSSQITGWGYDLSGEFLDGSTIPYGSPFYGSDSIGDYVFLVKNESQGYNVGTSYSRTTRYNLFLRDNSGVLIYKYIDGSFNFIYDLSSSHFKCGPLISDSNDVRRRNVYYKNNYLLVTDDISYLKDPLATSSYNINKDYYSHSIVSLTQVHMFKRNSNTDWEYIKTFKDLSFNYDLNLSQLKDTNYTSYMNKSSTNTPFSDDGNILVFGPAGMRNDDFLYYDIYYKDYPNVGDWGLKKQSLSLTASRIIQYIY